MPPTERLALVLFLPVRLTSISFALFAERNRRLRDSMILADFEVRHVGVRTQTLFDDLFPLHSPRSK